MDYKPKSSKLLRYLSSAYATACPHSLCLQKSILQQLPVSAYLSRVRSKAAKSKEECMLLLCASHTLHFRAEELSKHSLRFLL